MEIQSLIDGTMKFLIIFSVIMCGVAAAMFIHLGPVKSTDDLKNQQAYEKGRAEAWGEGIPVSTLTPIDPSPEPVRHIAPSKPDKSGWGSLAVMAIFVLVLIPLGLFVYFSPSIIGRGKRNAGAIFTLNLLTGWSFIGWVIAFVWACTQDPPAGAQS